MFRTTGAVSAVISPVTSTLPEALQLPWEGGEGILRLDSGNGVPGGRDQDGIAFHLSGADCRWRSLERCRNAIQQVVTALGPYATVRTTSLSLAILTARIGRKAILRMDADGAMRQRGGPG